MAFDERYSPTNVRTEINELFADVAATETDITALETLVLGNKAANLFLAGPTTGAAAAATFRAQVQADIPYTLVVTDATATYTIVLATLLNPRRLFVNLTNAVGATTLNLPALSAGLVGLEIIAFAPTGAANNVTATPAGGDTIAGVATISANNGFLRLTAISATQWAGY